jgi:hypothetical protein
MGFIRVKGADRGWQILGADRHPGILPTGISPQWDAWGSSQLTFALARDPALSHPDLQAFTPVEYLPYGEEPAWGGYITDTPQTQDGLSVNCRGLQGVLDDDPYQRVYVHERLSDYVDVRTVPGANLGNWRSNGQVINDGTLLLTYPKASTIAAGASLGAVLDLGPSSTARRVTIDYTWESAYNQTSLYVTGSDTPDASAAGSGRVDAVSGLVGGTGTGQISGSFSAPKRYVTILLYLTNGGADAPNLAYDVGVRITAARVYADPAYEAGGQSVLKATDILRYALGRAPVLDQSTAEVAQTAYSIRAFGQLGESRTARGEMEAVNSYHRYFLRVSPRGRLQFGPRLDRATIEANTRRAGVDWQDATINSGEDVYNKIVVTGTSGAGRSLTVTRLSSDVGIRNILDRRGRTRSKELQVQAPTDTVAMQQLADVWLARYARTPLKGTLTATGRALRDVTNGREIPPGMLGPRLGELILLSNLIDPDTGEHGRVAITVGGSYDETEDKATVAIDNSRDDIDAVLARMAVTSGN